MKRPLLVLVALTVPMLFVLWVLAEKGILKAQDYSGKGDGWVALIAPLVIFFWLLNDRLSDIRRDLSEIKTLLREQGRMR